MVSLGPNESDKNGVGLSCVLQSPSGGCASKTCPYVAVQLHLGFALAWNQVLCMQGQTKESQSVLLEGN